VACQQQLHKITWLKHFYFMWVISQFTFLEKNVYYSEDMKKPEIPRYTTNIGFFLLFWSSNSYDFV